jgi:hypothetical protein
MLGKFDSQLGLQNGDKTVAASGWIEWADLPAGVTAVRVGATIAQDEETQHERCGTGWSGVYMRPGNNARQAWQCSVPEVKNQQFNKAAARAGGVFISTNPDWKFPWGDNTTLH